MSKPQPAPGSEGYILVTVLLSLGVLSLLGAAALGLAQGSLKQARRAAEEQQAFYAANAGLEAALAEALSGADLASYTGLRQPPTALPAGNGQYSLSFTPTGTAGVIRVTSEGAAGAALRSLSARLRYKGEPGLNYEHLVFSSGTLVLDNHNDVCGDLYAAGDVRISAQTVLWGKSRAQDPASPCSEVYGTGKVRSGGVITFIGQAMAQGNWCDSLRYGPEYACSSPPPKLAISPPEMASLRARATRWYVRDGAFCAGKPAGSCSAVPAGYSHVLSGAQNFTTDLIYVEGNVIVGPAGWTTTGLVTVAATGAVSFQGNVQTHPTACATAGSCATAFITQGPQTVERGVSIAGTFITADKTDGFTWGSGAVIRGVVLAPKVESGNHATFYPIPQTDVWLPPGVPAPSRGAGNGVEFLDWSE